MAWKPLSSVSSVIVSPFLCRLSLKHFTFPLIMFHKVVSTIESSCGIQIVKHKQKPIEERN